MKKNKRWTDSEINKIIKLFNRGKTFKDISSMLNDDRTERSVQLKLNKLGYKSYDRKHIIKKCLNCKTKINTTIGENKKFCSQSCAATYNNKKRKRKKEIKRCLNCDNLINYRNTTYCNNKCQKEYKRKIIFKKIESNDFLLENKETESKWVKKYLINKYGEKCMKCGWNEIHAITKKVPIQMNHIDGNTENNNLDNVELLCPNCHSLTENFGSLNKGNGRTHRKIRRLNQKEKFGFSV